MKWEIIRNEKGEIIQYNFNENIFIKRVYTTIYNVSKYYHYLYVNNKCVECNEDGYTTLKQLKENARKYLKESGEQ